MHAGKQMRGWCGRCSGHPTPCFNALGPCLSLVQIQARRPELRIVVSSATLAAQDLLRFFHPAGALPSAAHVPNPNPRPGAPKFLEPVAVSIEGRTHPVEVRW